VSIPAASNSVSVAASARRADAEVDPTGLQQLGGSLFIGGVLLLVLVAVLIVISFRRSLNRVPERRRAPTRLTDPWAESARRMAVPPAPPEPPADPDQTDPRWPDWPPDTDPPDRPPPPEPRGPAPPRGSQEPRA
jgi:hypothetical protein